MKGNNLILTLILVSIINFFGYFLDRFFETNLGFPIVVGFIGGGAIYHLLQERERLITEKEAMK